MKNLKSLVKAKYAHIARQGSLQEQSNCAPSIDYSDISEDASETEGYVEPADLGLGCGLPVGLAQISQGDVVMDLGCGAGNDCFIARAETGPTGRVIGLDFVGAMIERAKRNRDLLNLENVSFIEGDIESIPIEDESVDVVVSNCVMNLVPDKQKAFSEIFRILKQTGHFSISDLVIEGPISIELQRAAEEYAGCVVGVLQIHDYLNIVESAGFQHIEIQNKRGIELPKELLLKHVCQDELSYYNSSYGIYSINLFATKH